ncbi:MAG: hypothetical protein ABI542_05340 [Gemmatimonadota bacterium]
MKRTFFSIIFAALVAVVMMISLSGLQRPLLAAQDGGGCPGVHPAGKCCACENAPEGTSCATTTDVGTFGCGTGPCPPTNNCLKGKEKPVGG